MTVISVVVRVLGTVLNGREKRLEELETGRRIETIQITALLKSVRILRRVLEIFAQYLLHFLSLRRADGNIV